MNGGGARKRKGKGKQMLGSDAVLFYADNPIYFVEDVIRAKPDEKQRDILRSLRDYPMTSVRSGHGIG